MSRKAMGAARAIPTGTYTEDEIRAARGKSYTAHAVAALVLGIFLWIPGLIATVLFRNEAKRTEKIAGQSLPGVGCLSTMFGMYMFGLIGVPLIIIFAIAASR